MLFDAFSDSDIGIGIRYHTDGSVFNLRTLEAKTKLKTEIVNVLLSIDDGALNTITKPNIQNSVDKFSVICDLFNFTITTKKTEVLH